MELRQRFHGCGHPHRQASYRTVAQLSAVGESNLGADGGKELHEMRLCPRQVFSARTRNCTTGNRHSALVIVRQSAHSPWVSRPCAWQETSAFYHASRSQPAVSRFSILPGHFRVVQCTPKNNAGVTHMLALLLHQPHPNTNAVLAWGWPRGIAIGNLAATGFLPTPPAWTQPGALPHLPLAGTPRVYPSVGQELVGSLQI
jgi:hypothetical protein